MNLAEIKDHEILKETESEDEPLNKLTVKAYNNNHTNKDNKIKNKNCKKNCFLVSLYSLVLIMLIFIIVETIINISENDGKTRNSQKSSKNLKKNEKKKNISTENKNIYVNNEKIENKGVITLNTKNITTKENEKIGVAFVYHILHSNGVARVIALTADHLIRTGRYNVYLITGKPLSKDYKYDSRIKRFVGHDNRTIIQNLKETLNIKYFILNNQLTGSLIKFIKSLNCKVIGIFHGVYLSAIFHNNTNGYKSWHKFGLYDSFITVAADDLYFYKKLGYKNAIFIPNLYTFEPSQSPESNLTYNNIVMLGRAHDKIKGTIYAIKAMSYIVKEVPDAKLLLATSDSKYQNLQNLAKEYNISNNVIFKVFPNISEVFLNSSVLMFTSLCEAFPMAMNEGKAYGLPVVAFDIPFSPPYQSGVITVPHLNVEALANETIKLLKDYNYRKRKGKEAKLSLNRFSNKYTLHLWEKLFYSLDKGESEYKKFQKEIEDKYYNEEEAREHVLAHFNNALRYNKHFRCHTFENMLNMKYIKNIKNCTNVT